MDFDEPGQVPDNIFEGEATSEHPEDITLSSSDSVVEEMRSMKKMALLRTCEAYKVQLDLLLMTSEQVDKIEIPLFLQVV
jgi:hypothetical protein